MKKLAVLILIAGFAVLLNCEYKTIEQVVAVGIDRSFQGSLDGSDEFETFTFTLTRAELLDRLDIPDDAEITDLQIESFAGKFTERDDSQADRVEMQVMIAAPTGDEEFVQLATYPINTESLEPFSRSMTRRVTDLLENELLLILKDQSSYFGLNAEIKIRAPERLSLDLYVDLWMNITYEICEEVPTILGIEGESCEP